MPLKFPSSSDREISARDCQGGRSDAAVAIASLFLPSPHPLGSRLRAKRFDPPEQRISHYRFRIFATLDRIALIRRKRRGSMSRDFDFEKLGGKQREEQDGHCRGWRRGTNQAARPAGTIVGAKRDDRLCGCAGPQW